MRLSTAAAIAALLVGAALYAADDPTPMLLWPNGAPGSEGKTAEEAVRTTPDGEHVLSSIHKPSITRFSPSKETNTGAAVIIAPGGGHSELWADHEGFNEARW